THQFFLTTDSLYLLVFKCRDQFRLDRAEYWLDTIRARAPEAEAAIVITECEKRTPYVPEDRLQAEYGDLLVDDKWLFAVGCEDDSGIPQLRHALKHWAADLDFMGRDWPASYGRAESDIEEKADADISHIDRGQLHDVFGDAGVDKERFGYVASSMATLGIITQFSDCPDLRDFIVLQPQWLTKAISEIMEDGKLEDDGGEISLQRMQEIWDDKGYEGLFPTFHNCMKEFELCYDLDHPDRGCLVPLRFGYIKPKIPWTLGENIKQRRVSYRLNIHPPMGLMSRFIVKTHHMIVSTDDHPNGVYWHNGVFLRTGEGPLTSEALCEFDAGERTLSVMVRAAFPQNMVEQIHAYVKAVFSFFAGLEPVRSYGCIRVDEQTDEQEQCGGMHTERRIYSAILKERILDCEYEFHDVDPRKLIWGLSSFGEYVVLSREELRKELDKTPAWAEPIIQDISTLLGWANENNRVLEDVRQGQESLAPQIKQEMEQKLREYLGHIGQMLDDREFTSAPGIISINTVDRSPWNPSTYFTKEYVLTPFCECERNVHPCQNGCVPFSKDRDWWITTAPWIARGTKVLSVGLQLAFGGMPVGMPASVFEAIKNDVAFMNELAKHIELTVDDADGSAEGITGRFDDDSPADMRKDHKEPRLMRAALSRFLEEVAPDNYRARQWGSLGRVRMSDNSYRWLCEDCTKRRKGSSS
ncbi:MAG: COR domain-containing protein, partial [Planctomycetota bacterium]